MYEIQVSHSFDSAHFLAGYPGKCAQLHGHRWQVEVTLQAGELVAAGGERDMVLDFTTVKQELKALLEAFDHVLIVEAGSLRETTLQCLQEEGFPVVQVPFRPTAEAFAAYFFHRLRERLPQVSQVAVYETPGNRASYTRSISQVEQQLSILSC